MSEPRAIAQVKTRASGLAGAGVTMDVSNAAPFAVGQTVELYPSQYGDGAPLARAGQTVRYLISAKAGAQLTGTMNVDVYANPPQVEAGWIIDGRPSDGISGTTNIPSQGPAVTHLQRYIQDNYTPAPGDSGGYFGFYYDLNTNPSGDAGVQTVGFGIFLNKNTAGNLGSFRGFTVTMYQAAAGTITDSRLFEAAVLSDAGNQTLTALFDAALGMTGTATATEIIAYRARQVSAIWATRTWGFWATGANWLHRLEGKVTLGGSAAVVPTADSAELDVQGHLLQLYNRYFGNNQAWTNNTTLSDVTYSPFPGRANKTYDFYYDISWDGAAAADLKFVVTAPAGAGGSINYQNDDVLAGAPLDALKGAAFVPTSASIVVQAGTGGNRLRIWGSVVMGATPGNIKLQAAQNVANAVPTTIYSTSKLKVDELHVGI